MTERQRLSKWLAASGVAARRTCEELIFSGRVKVNGQIILLPQTLVSKDDEILVDGKSIGEKEKKVYYILNKPIGYVCSAVGTKRVLDLFDEVEERLFTVGRLDKDSAGLLIVTNDGHFANSVIHPSANIHKEYLVKVAQEVSPDHLAAMASGAQVEGVFVKPIRVTKVRRGTFKIVVSEGKKREVRHLADMAGLKVLELTRIRIGGLHLGNLANGAYRTMTEKDRLALFH
jgi:23S rRNA pseudouridine2605 synthase